jgi:Flp pilus assembly secretin CpaC/uncharacterized membrane protein YgcG
MESFIVKRFPDRRLGTVALTGFLSVATATTTLLCAAPAMAQAAERDLESVLSEARGHLEAARYSAAVRAYSEALAIDGGNVEATEGLRVSQQLLNQGPVLPADGQPTDRDVLREQVRVEYDDALGRSREALARGDFSNAESIALEAKVRVQVNRDLFNQSELSDRLARADALRVEIQTAREEAELARIREQIEEATSAQREAALREQERIRTSINEKLVRVRQLQLEQNYQEALAVVDEILFLDERNPSAQILRDVLETAMLYRQASDWKRGKEMSYLKNSILMEDRMVLPTRNLTGPGRRGLSEVLQYPDDWEELSLRRFNETGFVDTEANRQVLGTLRTTNVPVNFDGNSFDSVLTYLETVSGLDIYVDWKSLDLDSGIDETEEVSLQLGDVPMELALERVLEQLGDEDTRPRWAIRDGILTVASDEALRKERVLAVYDIRDLTFEVPYFDNAPDFDLDSALDQGQNGGGGGQGGGGGGGGIGGSGGGGGGGGGRGGGGGGSGSLFGGAAGEVDRNGREQLIQDIIDIIQEQVDRDGWADFGGETGTIQELNGNLIITNTPENHRDIEGLLDQLREIRALQINVESRVLSVSNDWFERIGIDLDLYFNTNSDARNAQLALDPLGRLSDFFGADGQLLDPLLLGPIPAADADEDTPGIQPDFPFNGINYGQAVGIPQDLDGDGIPETVTFAAGPSVPIRATQGFTPVGVTQNSLDLLDVIGSATGFGANVLSGAPALATGFSFLDDIQVDLLVEATQADQRSVILTAPRLTFFNGQRAWIAIQRQEAFVSGLTPITGDSAAGFQPTIDRVSSGIRLDLEAVISADRRYVTMTTVFDQSEIVEFRETSAQGAVGGGFGGGDAGAFEGTIQLPIIAVSSIRTTVSVPDKGTVLLGGLRTTEEIEVETGVPVLSKIPFINRFFTNRQTSKAETTLLVLMRPEIIIQQEAEDIIYPGLNDSIGYGAGLR